MSTYYIKEAFNNVALSLEPKKLGSGGEGDVYKVTAPNHLQGMCFKKYIDKYQNHEKQHKIEFMIVNPPHNLNKETVKICWPLNTVYDNNHKFVGYLMPLAYENSEELYHLTLNKSKRLPYSWQKFFNDTQESRDLSLKICVNLCSATYSIHNLKQYIFVDFKPQNVMFTNDGRVSLVDCDSLQINKDDTGHTHYGRVNTAEYTPPEGATVVVSQTLINESWDRFSLAVVLYQLMFRVHPYTATFTAPYQELASVADKIKNNLFVYGRGNKYLASLPPPHKGFVDLNPQIQSLFQKAFAQKTNQRRPSSVDWGKTLYELIQSNSHGLRPQTAATASASPVIPTYSAQEFSSPNRQTYTPPVINSNSTSTQTLASQTPSATSYKPLLWVVIAAVIGYFIISGINKNNDEAYYMSDGITEAEAAAEAELAVAEAEAAIAGAESAIYEATMDKEQSYETEERDAQEMSVATSADDQCFYVLSDKANIRQYPRLNAPVAFMVDYNSRLCATGTPPSEGGNDRVWLHVIDDYDNAGWISSNTLSQYPRTIYESQCYSSQSENRYIVNAVGVNIRKRPSQDDDAVIGVVKQGELVCPYKYVNSNDSAIGRWLGFRLTTGETAWIAETLLESYDSNQSQSRYADDVVVMEEPQLY